MCASILSLNLGLQKGRGAAGLRGKTWPVSRCDCRNRWLHSTGYANFGPYQKIIIIHKKKGLKENESLELLPHNIIHNCMKIKINLQPPRSDLLVRRTTPPKLGFPEFEVSERRSPFSRGWLENLTSLTNYQSPPSPAAALASWACRPHAPAQQASCIRRTPWTLRF